MVDPVWMFVLGALCLVGAAVLYARDTAKYLFPVIFALIGVFLCAAQSVTAKLPGGVDVEFQRTVKDSTRANVDALATQQTAIDAIAKQLTGLTKQFTDYQADVNQRFAQLNTAPVPVPTPQPGLTVSPGALSAIVKQSEQKKIEALQANRELQRLAIVPSKN